MERGLTSRAWAANLTDGATASSACSASSRIGDGLLPVTTRPPNLTSASSAKPPEPSLEVVLTGGRRIGIRPGFHPGTLQELLIALELG